MIIYFVRHASAGQHIMNPKKDEKRPLDKDGIEQCGFIGRALAALDVHPRVAMQILRHSKIAVTMEIYTNPRELHQTGAFAQVTW